jgi:hypothetical protein
MLLAGGDGVGLAGFEDGITCVGVGLDLFRARCLQDGSRMSGGIPILPRSAVQPPWWESQRWCIGRGVIRNSLIRPGGDFVVERARQATVTPWEE